MTGLKRSGWAWMILALFARDVQAQVLQMDVVPNSFSFGITSQSPAPYVEADRPIVIDFTVTDDQGEGWRITALAEGDLVGPGTTIPIEEVSWEAFPSPPFMGGRLSRSAPQIVAQGTGPARIHGTLHFRLRNRWDYVPGDYTQTVNFTLSMP